MKHWHGLLIMSLILPLLATPVTVVAADGPDAHAGTLRQFAVPRADSWSTTISQSDPKAGTNTPRVFGELRLNTASDGTGDDFNVNTPAFVPFTVYLVADIDFGEDGRPGDNLTNGLSAWEAGLNFPPEVAVLGLQLIPPTSINVASNFGEFIVGTGSFVSAFPPVSVVRIDLLTLQPQGDVDLVIDMHTVSPPSQPGELAWTETNNNFDLNFFARWRENRFVINCVNEPECNPDIGNGLVVDIGEATVDVGPVSVPVTVRRTNVAKSGNPAEFAGLDLLLSWDPALADLVNVSLAPPFANWFLEFNAGIGTVDISMATLDVVNVPEFDLDMLNLEFVATGTPGDSPISFLDADAFDLAQQPIPLALLEGSIATGCDKGDVVPDGEVNSADAIRALLFSVGLLQPTALEFCAADMNSDGVIDGGDIVLILQKAVGIILAVEPGEATKPTVYARSGYGAGEVVLHLEDAAALDVILSYDAASMSFVSAEAPGSEALVATNSQFPGFVRLGFAKSNAYSGEVLIHFETNGRSAPVHILSVVAFDEVGLRHDMGLNGTDVVFGVTAAEDIASRGTYFMQATPNPFNPRTELRFSLQHAGDATLKVYDVAGRLVRTIALTGLAVGEHSVTWNGQDDTGNSVASGTYIVRLEAAGAVDSGRVTLLK